MIKMKVIVNLITKYQRVTEFGTSESIYIKAEEW